MYSSRGGNAYGQQSYAGQQAYGQNSGAPYSGSSVGGPDGGSQLSIPSRHSSMLGGSQEADVGGYRAHPSAVAQYGGQYGALYGSSALTSGQQVATMSGKVAGSSALQGRGGYASAMEEPTKFASGDYGQSSSHGYGHKVDQFSSGKISDYSSLDRRQYGEHQSAYIGRELQSESSRRYTDSVGLSQLEIYDHIDQASLLRQQQMLKAQSLQSASLDGGARPTDYLTARGATIRHATQDLSSYGGRMDSDPRNLSMLGGSSYGGQTAPSILGAAPRREIDDLMYAQGSSSAGYGVSLPPGRDYATGKGLRGPSLESDYPSSVLSRGGHPSVGGSRIDQRKDDRGELRRELEIREEERRREHVREREKEREKEREREREREREHERERLLERRDKERERERERKRGAELRRERTPPRIMRERLGSSLMRNERPLRRDSPRHEALHRRHSPVKEKRREYVCKVYPFCLVDVERDYLSINKRYSRLSISPEFSKVVLHWPKENIKLSLHTPVSFGHDLVEVESKAEQKEPSTEPLSEESGKSNCGRTVWNAKVILMSGISRDALEELSSDKTSDDRIPHFSNILRFAILRQDRSFMAIGGPWDVVDGGDPSVDESSLIQTVCRHAKDLTQLDLHNCQHWNRFLEIHYDRVGKDGLFSHKEITVLFVPDLSDCLPSLEVWRDQWQAQKKAIAEREHQLALKKEKSSEKKEGVKGDRSLTKSDKGIDSPKNAKVEGSLAKDGKEEKKDSHGTPSKHVADVKNMDKDDDNEVKEKAAEGEVDVGDKKLGGREGEVGGEGKHVKKEEQEEISAAQATGTPKPGKKRIVKKIVKQKVADKKASMEVTVSKQNEKLDEKDVEDKQAKPENTVQQDETSADPSGVRTFTRKKIVKKVPVGKTAQKENKGVNPDDMQAEVKAEKEVDASAIGETSVKTTVKKKIIKRVPKRKATGMEDKGGNSDSKKDDEKDENKVMHKGSEIVNVKELVADANKQVVEVNKSEKKKSSKMESKKMSVETQGDGANSSERENKADKEGNKEHKGADSKKESGSEVETGAAKEKVSNKDSLDGKRERMKDEKEKRNKDRKDESKGKSSKEVKEKAKPDEPPQHPGLFLQTKWNKEPKLRSLSLSLDSLLDYTDKDIEESTFELSLFAESLYEMLQYQMGSCLLTFLQKLRIKFVSKRNQRKRLRDENPEKENDKEKSSRKRSKFTDEPPVENESTKAQELDAANPDCEETKAKEVDASADGVEESKTETYSEDDPEEDVDEDEEMKDASPQNDVSTEAGNEDGIADAKAKPNELNDTKNEAKECAEEQTDKKTDETEVKSELEQSKDKDAEVGTEKKANVVVDKELLQAFRFFDRNRVGYIKVEDLRLVLHNLGKFLSHRDVKELVQSALLESNTARDNRILYNKLVRMSDN